MNIYLIGYRATGKTTVGSALATKLNRRFIDVDQIIEENTGMPVSEIVTRFGWDEFRRKEAAVISDIAHNQQEKSVVATGGGVVLNPENTKNLRRSGTVVWLDAPASTITLRMESDPHTKTLRPPLTENAMSLEEEVKNTLGNRLSLYEQASHIRINTAGQNIEAICAKIIALIKDRL